MSSNLNVNNHQENIHQNSQQESNLNHCLIDNKNDDCQIDCNIDNNNNNNVINDDNILNNNVKQMNKVERIREYINQCVSDKSKKKISNIINNVIELTDIEKALLYLNLPTGSSQESENLKINKPGNPFGKKADSEVSQTFIWIKTHLEENSSTSLPKHEVYDEYKLFCESNQSQPVCQADFGKLMKHLFPNVKPRRLGQRGNSRYCYSGLRKKTNFDKPELPDVFVLKDRNKDDNLINNKINKTTNNLDQQLSLHISNDKNLIQSASSYLVLEWARKFFNHKLTSLKDLAKHLINLNHIDKKSMAALTIIASDDDIPNDNEFQNLHNNLTTINQTNLNLNQFDNNDLIIKGKKNSEDFKISTSKNKSTTNSLTFKRSSDTQKKDKQTKKKLDKEFMKSNCLNKVNKSINTTGKLPKLMKIKKTRIKKENLRNDNLNSTILDDDKLTASETKIKLESFGNLTNKFNNPIEINKTKNPIHEENNNQFINNTQQFKSTSNFDQLNLKRRHSTAGFHYSNHKQFDNPQINDLNYKYQLKRQTSEHFDSTNKKSNLEQSTNLNLQSTNYLTNELNSTKANNQLISYKKCFDINNKSNIINNDSNANLMQQQNENQNDSLNANNVLNQTISTQVNEQELYQLNNNNNNLFNNNQLINPQSVNNLNQNDIFVPKQNLINNYNETATNSNGMCNVNTQMPSIPASPINQTKDSFAANQFQQTNNQIINDKLVDFNNNLSNITANIQQNYSTSTYTDEQIQINNCQHLNNNQKMFLNPSNQQSLLNKNSINNRPLNRVRHSSGPSYTYSSMLYNSNNPTNNFLSNNNNLTNVRSNSLSPLYENCSLDNQKMINFNNSSNFQQQYSTSNNNNSMKFTFASNPTSPVSEPISPNIIGKKMTNLRFSKFNNLEHTTKKDGTRSASFTGSNSSEPFLSFARTRQRHMSSPYILSPNINSNNDFSTSTQSLTNSTSFNSSNLTTFNSTNDVFIQQQNNSINMIDDHNSNNLNNLNNMNNISINQTNPNLQDNYVSLINKSNYEYPLSPPLSSNIIGEEKSFNNHLSMDLQNNNSITISSNFNQSIQEFQQNNTINSNLNFTNLMNTNNNIRQLNEQQPIDDLQETLQDLKEICDKDL